MRNLFLIASAAAITVAMPVPSEAQGPAKGKGQAAQAQGKAKANTNRNRVQNRNEVQTRSDVRSDHWVRTPDGSWVRVGANGQLSHPQGCPPGLAKRTPSCIPPGQVRHVFREGQRLPANYRYYTDYEAIPELYRQRFNIPTGQRYVYRDSTVYVVDPTTRIVRSIIDLIR
jgi:hypothetical protein